MHLKSFLESARSGRSGLMWWNLPGLHLSGNKVMTWGQDVTLDGREREREIRHTLAGKRGFEFCTTKERMGAGAKLYQLYLVCFLKETAALCRWTKQAAHGKYQLGATGPRCPCQAQVTDGCARNEADKIRKLREPETSRNTI